MVEFTDEWETLSYERDWRVRLEKGAVDRAGNLPRVGALGFLSHCLGLGSGVISPTELPLSSSLLVRIKVSGL